MRPHKILVVDDTPEVRSFLSRVLMLEGYEVLEADDGEEALAASQKIKGDLDLLLTDVKMPGMDGITLAGELTACYPSIHVLFVSGERETDILKSNLSHTGFSSISK